MSCIIWTESRSINKDCIHIGTFFFIKSFEIFCTFSLINQRAHMLTPAFKLFHSTNPHCICCDKADFGTFTIMLECIFFYKLSCKFYKCCCLSNSCWTYQNIYMRRTECCFFCNLYCFTNPVYNTTFNEIKIIKLFKRKIITDFFFNHIYIREREFICFEHFINLLN